MMADVDLQKGDKVTVKFVGGFSQVFQVEKLNKKTVVLSNGVKYSLSTLGAIGKNNRSWISAD